MGGRQSNHIGPQGDHRTEEFGPGGWRRQFVDPPALVSKNQSQKLETHHMLLTA